MMKTVQKFALTEDWEGEKDQVKEKGGKKDFKKKKGSRFGVVTQVVPASGNQVQQFSPSNFPKSYVTRDRPPRLTKFTPLTTPIKTIFSIVKSANILPTPPPMKFVKKNSDTYCQYHH